MRRIDDGERRRRLATRHRLVPATHDDDVAAAAASVVALHGTDPGSTFASTWARTASTGVTEVEQALYVDRSVVRVMAMRRTVFVAPTLSVPTLLAGAADDVTREERRKLVVLLDAAGTPEPAQWLHEVERLALAVVEASGEALPADLVAADPRLATTVVTAPGTANETTVRIASRLLTILAADGRIVRGRPRGSWTSTQFRWSSLASWAPEASARLDPTVAEVALARAYLDRFGPVLEDDLVWWTGWTKTRARRALAGLDVVEVALDAGAGLVLADDLAPTPDPGPWTALLPALDPSPMGYRHRDHYLGGHARAVFDTTGNICGTAWSDGRIVGGWAHLPSGEVAVRLLDDVGRETSEAIEAHADQLSTTLGDVRLAARGRRTSPLERQLLGG